MLRTWSLTILVAVVLLGLVVTGMAMGGSRHRLTNSLMASLVGAVSCYNCRSAKPLRFDECNHTNHDPRKDNDCLQNSCLENEVVGDTCDLGAGNCTASLDEDDYQIIQTERVDTNCTPKPNTNKYHDWVTFYYYDTCCKPQTWQVACDKANGSCDGDMVHDYSIVLGPRIKCPP